MKNGLIVLLCFSAVGHAADLSKECIAAFKAKQKTGVMSGPANTRIVMRDMLPPGVQDFCEELTDSKQLDCVQKNLGPGKSLDDLRTVCWSKDAATTENFYDRCMTVFGDNREVSKLPTPNGSAVMRGVLPPGVQDFCETVRTKTEFDCVKENASARASLKALKNQCLAEDPRCRELTLKQRASTPGCKFPTSQLCDQLTAAQRRNTAGCDGENDSSR